jgi:hypothetical protein
LIETMHRYEFLLTHLYCEVYGTLCIFGMRSCGSAGRGRVIGAPLQARESGLMPALSALADPVRSTTTPLQSFSLR